ncbi:YceI family protein [Leptobacterium flavescens]|uniref:YceI family protein n=1 Tax=Leptobacterium flavescens TaxID=472055 RepID=A0A6P0UJQ4_9FLAO|nr:YceI family protein [Leptobacterium flavescens]NER13444.1 YceI family protein [Leptobacterium flavescens]
MNKTITLILILIVRIGCAQEPDQYITRQGQASFFSYTSVENIQATNNQVLSIIDLSKKEIAVSMLMRAFVFEKSLMEEHFNESYIESDIYPKATFQGQIQDFDPSINGEQTRIVKGQLTIHGVTRETEIKTKIEKTGRTYVLSGDFELRIKDYEIKVPPILARNIAKTISVTFSFKYIPYEK